VSVTINWFVLYVRTASEERVLGLLKTQSDADTYTTFIPRKVWPHVKNGSVVSKEVKICFPGYVFIRSLKSVDDAMQKLLPTIYGIHEAYHFLYYGDDKRDMALQESERSYIERLMNTEFCMESSIGFLEGDYVKVVSGALTGIESQIIKINKHKRTAVIETDMFGTKRQITLMLEVLEKALV
jgi:transcriptional antiterminator NusG